MRKLVLMGVLILALILASCQLLVSKEDLLKDAETALQSGDLDTAEQKFGEVLNMDENDPTANAGMAIIKFFRAFTSTLNWFNEEASGTTFSSVVYPFIRSGGDLEALKKRVFLEVVRNTTTFDLQEFLDEIEQAQNEMENELIPKYEEALEYINRALESGGFEITIYPNNLDMDGDGTVEPNQPIKFFTSFGKHFTIEDFYKCTVPPIADNELVFIDQSGGDAWFDYDAVVAMINEEESCPTPHFDDNDYIVFDEGELYFMKMVSEYALGVMYAFTTYSFQMPSDTVNAIQNFINTEDINSLIEYFDYYPDSKISQTELKNRFGTFLSFRENGMEHLPGSLIAFKASLESILSLDEDIKSDSEDSHNLTSTEFFPEGILDDESRGEIQEMIGYLTDEPIVTENATINLFVLKNNPSNFADLKDYFPDIYYEEGKLVFPDPNFGGLIESDWDGVIQDSM